MMEQAALNEGGNVLWTILPIAAAIVLALVGVIWKLLNGKIDKQAEDMKGIWKDQEETRTDLHDHDIQLAQGDVKWDQIQTSLRDMHDDIKDIKRNCPKCVG